LKNKYYQQVERNKNIFKNHHSFLLAFPRSQAHFQFTQASALNQKLQKNLSICHRFFCQP